MDFTKDKEIKRFDVFVAKLQAQDGTHVEAKARPVVVVSNDKANTYSPVISVVPLTSQNKKNIPTHVPFHTEGLAKQSTALCEQILTVDRANLGKRIGYVADYLVQDRIDRALRIQLNLD